MFMVKDTTFWGGVVFWKCCGKTSPSQNTDIPLRGYREGKVNVIQKLSGRSFSRRIQSNLRERLSIVGQTEELLSR